MIQLHPFSDCQAAPVICSADWHIFTITTSLVIVARTSSSGAAAQLLSSPHFSLDVIPASNNAGTIVADLALLMLLASRTT